MCVCVYIYRLNTCKHVYVCVRFVGALYICMTVCAFVCVCEMLVCMSIVQLLCAR